MNEYRDDYLRLSSVIATPNGVLTRHMAKHFGRLSSRTGQIAPIYEALMERKRFMAEKAYALRPMVVGYPGKLDESIPYFPDGNASSDEPDRDCNYASAYYLKLLSCITGEVYN